MRIFALSLMLDRQPIIFEDGRQVRDFVNITDVVAANVLVLSHPETIMRYSTWGAGRPGRWLIFTRPCRIRSGKKFPPAMGRFYRYGDTRHIFSDTGKLQSLGWRPTVASGTASATIGIICMVVPKERRSFPMRNPI